MAVKTFMVAAGADGNFGALVDGVDQAAASRTDGWTVAKLGTAQSAEFDNGTKQASGAFSAEAITTKPASFLTGTTANAFKTPDALAGTFASGFWTATFAVRATVASSQTGRIRMMMYKAAADGSSPTLTASRSFGSTTAALSTTADVTTIWTPNLGAVSLTNQFLFFVAAWEIVVASGNNSGDVVIRTGQASTGSQIVTPDFTPAAAAEIIPDVGMALTVT